MMLDEVLSNRLFARADAFLIVSAFCSETMEGLF